MVHYCSDCLYHDLEPDSFPCKKCSEHDMWTPQIDNLKPDEILSTILKNQFTMLLELGHLRNEIESLKKE